MSHAAIGFGVDRKTIYRWVDALGLRAAVGIPDSPNVPTPQMQPASKCGALSTNAQPRFDRMSTATFPDAEQRVNTSIRIKESVWHRMRKLAIDRRCTASDLMEQAAEDFVQRLEVDAAREEGSK